MRTAHTAESCIQSMSVGPALPPLPQHEAPVKLLCHSFLLADPRCEGSRVGRSHLHQLCHLPR